MPPPRPLPMEQTMTEQFTIEQLREFFKQVSYKSIRNSIDKTNVRNSSLH
jgi:hypothetical protein